MGFGIKNMKFKSIEEELNEKEIRRRLIKRGSDASTV
jgi:hypothetical protein